MEITPECRLPEKRDVIQWWTDIFREKAGKSAQITLSSMKHENVVESWGRVGWGCGRGPGKLCVPLEKFWLCPCQPFVWLPPYKHYRTLKLLIT